MDSKISNSKTLESNEQQNMHEKIRLVIWDLDETFWKGTLSEGGVDIPRESIEIIKTLTDRGIVNSICSKNDYQKVKERLEDSGLWSYFVFPQISWGPKGPAVKKIIEDIKLRPSTVLFIDDNTTNLNEVKYFVPDINISMPDIMLNMLDNPLFEGKDDKEHSRLKQYHVLEAKKKDEERFDNNEDFLRQSGIKVDICIDDLEDNINRLWELNQRTNQLNYTKNRLSKEEFEALIAKSDVKKGFVKVCDNYGDYGIVGFFAVENRVLTNFYFSCRTIGLGVEQYVYAKLGFPQISITGEVATPLNTEICPDWINSVSSTENNRQSKHVNGKILLLGGCDLEQTAFYLEQAGVDFRSRFNYVVRGRYESHPDEVEAIRASLRYDDEERKYLLEQCLFIDEGIFVNNLLDEKYDIVVYSPLIDFGQGFYQSIRYPDVYVSYGNISDTHDNRHSYLSPSDYDKFSREFNLIGSIPDDRFIENLEIIRETLSPETLLLLLNGSVQDINHPNEPDRKKLHEHFNHLLSSFANRHNNVKIVDVNQFIRSKADHTDSIRHYQRKIYYRIAENILIILKKRKAVDDLVAIKEIKYKRPTIKVRIKTLLLNFNLLKFGYVINRFFKT